MKFLLAIFLLVLASPAADVTQGNFGGGAGSEAAPRQSRRAAAAPKSLDSQKRQRSYPFYGHLASSDSKSITLKGKTKNRVILIAPDTRIEKNGATATLAEAAPGERVSGIVRKNSEGKEEAVHIRFGEKPKKSKPGK